MHHTIRLITLASSLLFSSMPASAEDEGSVTLVSNDSSTNSLTLEKGESAKLVFTRKAYIIGATGGGAANPGFVDFRIRIGDKTFSFANQTGGSGLTIAGPAVITLENIQLGFEDSERCIATFEVKKIGTASPPAQVPQEAGSNFDVILEQSSDLVNWTPANPGAYSGTETKRFFRTRIVKKQ
jgi:hypothetical protein